MLHVDGDLLVYRCGFAAEKASYSVLSTGDRFEKHVDMINWFRANQPELKKPLAGEHYEQTRTAEPVENALHNVKSVLQTVIDKFSSHEATVYLSGPTNFRTGVATLRPYKGNRDPSHKPVHGPAIKEYIHSHYNVVVSDGEEADDAIAQAHFALWKEHPASSIIVSTDKDLLMVPGLHYNFVKDLMVDVDELEAIGNFYCQLVSGDPTDNIPGVPSYGEVKAYRLVSSILDPLVASATYDSSTVLQEAVLQLQRSVLRLYVEGYGEEQARKAMNECAELLWIRRERGVGWGGLLV